MFDKLLKAAVGIVTLPVDVVADVITFGGIATDKDEPYTVTKAKRIRRQIDEASK